MARTMAQPGPERTNRLIFIGAAILAVIAAILVFAALNTFGKDDSNPNTPVATDTTVVIASRNIEAGTKVTDDMLEVTTLPRNGVVSGALSAKSTAIGATTRVALIKGEQFTDVKLGQSAKGSIFSNVVLQGKRAAAVKVDETSFVGGLPVAGDHVDVIVIGKRTRVDPTQPEKEFPSAYVLLQDVEIGSVSDVALKPTAPLDQDGNPVVADVAVGNTSVRNDKTSADPSAGSVTLLVDPAQQVLLALATEEYKVYLTLRANGDQGKVNDGGTPVSLPGVQ